MVDEIRAANRVLLVGEAHGEVPLVRNVIERLHELTCQRSAIVQWNFRIAHTAESQCRRSSRARSLTEHADHLGGQLAR
jgi:hypothetical protein